MSVWLLTVVVFGGAALGAEVTHWLYTHYRAWRVDRLTADFAARFDSDTSHYRPAGGKALSDSAEQLGRKKA